MKTLTLALTLITLSGCSSVQPLLERYSTEKKKAGVTVGRNLIYALCNELPGSVEREIFKSDEKRILHSELCGYDLVYRNGNDE